MNLKSMLNIRLHLYGISEKAKLQRQKAGQGLSKGKRIREVMKCKRFEDIFKGEGTLLYLDCAGYKAVYNYQILLKMDEFNYI